MPYTTAIALDALSVKVSKTASLQGELICLAPFDKRLASSALLEIQISDGGKGGFLSRV